MKKPPEGGFGISLVDLDKAESEVQGDRSFITTLIS